MNRQAGGHASSHESSVGAIPAVLRLIVIFSCITSVASLVYARREQVPEVPGAMLSETPPIESTVPVQEQATPPPAGEASSADPAPPGDPGPLVEVPTVVPHVGIVAGHWGSDTGAVCPDGLTEVEINLDVARRVVRLLQETRGYQVDLLEEMDPRLEGYQADVLVSIHADSCQPFPNATPAASGFKVASVEGSMVHEAETRLVNCLAQCYAARTDMYFHKNSITPDMTQYHTFFEIDHQTPGAIIETGFMYHDRLMLTQRPDLVAQGIVDGIVCFLEGEVE